MDLVLLSSATLCLLIGPFSPLKLKVIVDKFVFIAMLYLVFPFILCFLFYHFLFLFLFLSWFDDLLCVILTFFSFRFFPARGFIVHGGLRRPLNGVKAQSAFSRGSQKPGQESELREPQIGRAHV